MARKPRVPLDVRVTRAAEATLADQNHVSPVDILVGIGWLDTSTLERWRRGQIDCLETALNTNPDRVLEALKLLRDWAGG